MMKVYKGENLKRKAIFIPNDENGNPLKDYYGREFPKEEILPYISNPEIEELVTLMQILNRPLLIKGAPGSGKTRLAKAVAYEFYGDKYRNYYFEWNIKSTTNAKDGLYNFDHISRLRDAQVIALKQGIDSESINIQDDWKYIEFKPLGKALKSSTKENPCIILIDEIDKADIDFPNDLLLELDQKRFELTELQGVQINALHSPLVFITSNNEKELPPAFLRRCLFYHIDSPSNQKLNEIAIAHFPNLPSKIREKAVLQFFELRKQMEKTAMTKHTPSTSEMVDWIKILYFKFLNKLSSKLGLSSDQKNDLSQIVWEMSKGGKLDKGEEEKLEEIIQKMNIKFGKKEQLLMDQAIDEYLFEMNETLLHHQALIKHLSDLKRNLPTENHNV